MKLLQLHDLSESDRLVNGEGLFSLSFLDYSDSDPNFSFLKVNNAYYFKDQSLEKIQNINNKLFSKEIAKIEKIILRKKIFFSIILFFYVALIIAGIVTKSYILICSIATIFLAYYFFFKSLDFYNAPFRIENNKAKKQYAIRLIETIFNNLSDTDKKEFINQLKSARHIKLSNPRNDLNSKHTKIDYINDLVFIETDDVIYHFYNNML